MRRYSSRATSSAVLAVAVLTALLAGCSSGNEHPASSTSAAPASSTEHKASAEAQPAQPIGISPGGVTTKVDVPAESTEEQYSHACHAAKEWIHSQGGDPQTHIEPFLQKLQTSNESGPATFNSSWAQLSLPQQAAVIVAVEAAVSGGC